MKSVSPVTTAILKMSATTITYPSWKAFIADRAFDSPNWINSGMNIHDYKILAGNLLVINFTIHKPSHQAYEWHIQITDGNLEEIKAWAEIYVTTYKWDFMQSAEISTRVIEYKSWKAFIDDRAFDSPIWLSNGMKILNHTILNGSMVVITFIVNKPALEKWSWHIHVTEQDSEKIKEWVTAFNVVT